MLNLHVAITHHHNALSSTIKLRHNAQLTSNAFSKWREAF